MNSKANTIDFIANQSNKTFETKNALGQHTITPVIQKLCKQLDENMLRLLNDIEFTTNLSLNNNSIPVNQIAEIINEDFKCFNEYLQANLQIFSDNLYKSLTYLINNLKSDENNDLNIKKILLICRFASALSNFCPNLKMCFSNLNQQYMAQRQLNSKTGSLNDLFSPQLNNLLKKKILSDQKVLIKLNNQ